MTGASARVLIRIAQFGRPLQGGTHLPHEDSSACSWQQLNPSLRNRDDATARYSRHQHSSNFLFCYGDTCGAASSVKPQMSPPRQRGVLMACRTLGSAATKTQGRLPRSPSLIICDLVLTAGGGRTVGRMASRQPQLRDLPCHLPTVAALSRERRGMQFWVPSLVHHPGSAQLYTLTPVCLLYFLNRQIPYLILR